MKICCLCKEEIPSNPLNGWDKGNNPAPLGKNQDDRCCDICNAIYVLPARLNAFYSSQANSK